MARPFHAALRPASWPISPTEAIDRIAGIHPGLQRAALAARDAVAYASIVTRVARENIGASARIDPFALHRADPTRIDRAMRPFDAPKWKLAGRVLGGDWDRETRPFTEIDGYVHFDVYDSFAAHFREGVPWEETEFFDRLLAEVRRGRHWWGCTSEADVRDRCATLDRLYHRIETEGYRPQRALDRDALADASEIRRSTAVNRIVEGEIAVNVGRDGELIFYDGRNRLAIAKLLELETIPVVILVRHRRWQRLRERLARGDLSVSALPDRLRTHPDLRAVLETETGSGSPGH